MASFDLIPDVEKGQLKLIYKALSEDLKIAAKKYGGDKAVKEVINANKFYSKGLQRIEDYLQPIVNTADPDKLVMSCIKVPVKKVQLDLTPLEFFSKSK